MLDYILNLESYWLHLVPLVIVSCIFYFLLILPYERHNKEQKRLLKNLRCGSEVLTDFGLVGIVKYINTKNNTITLQVSYNVELVVLNSVISKILSEKNKTILKF